MDKRLSPVTRAGFTAIEMIVVLSVLLVLASMTTPGLVRTLRRGELNDAVNAVANLNTRARLFAREHEPVPNKSYGIRIDGSQRPNTVEITYPGATVAGLPPGVISRVAFNRNVQLCENGVAIDTKSWNFRWGTGAVVNGAGSPINVGITPPLSLETLDGALRVALAVYEVGIVNAESF